MAATRSKDAGAARADRELTLKAAAELTGCTGKTLRRHIRDGRLRPASMDGSRLTVTLSALRDAGLLPASGAEDRAAEIEEVVDEQGAEREAAEREAAAREAAAREAAAREAAAREAAEREAAERARAERAEREARQRAEKEARESAEKARADKDAREKSERERAAREKAVREKAERARAENEARDRSERDKAEREKAEKARAEKEAREKSEREKAERDKADKARAEKESRERAEREMAERAKGEREKADKARVERESREKAEREREAAKVVPMSRPRPHLEEFDDLAGQVDDGDDAADESLDEREIAALEGELDDLAEPEDSDDEVVEAETVRLEAEPRATEARVVSAERGMVVSGSGPWVTSNQLADLMRLLAAEREARSQEWMERTESLYREMIDSQKLRITSLEDESKALQSKLEDALRLVPKGENVQGLEQVIRDLRIELDRKEAARADLEHERDRLRDLTDRLRNDLSRAEKRNLEMAEQLRRFRAQGIFDRLVGREPDDR